jgi:hypothetical protein
VEAVSPVLKNSETNVGELKIAEHQPEYRTLPALDCGAGVLLTRWDFEPGERERFAGGAPVKLYILHGIGSPAQPCVIVSREPSDLRPPMLDELLAEGTQEDPRYTVFRWRPFDLEREDVLASGSLYLYLWTHGGPVQPLMLKVEEV